MAQLVEDIVTTLDANWRLNELPDEWVKATVDGNFSEFDALSDAVQPSVLDSDELCDRLNQLARLFSEYERCTDSAELWTALSEAGVKSINLVVMLFYAVERGLKKDASFEHQKMAILASRAYLAVCAVSGSQAYGNFNYFFYQRVTECVRLAVRLSTSDKAHNTTTQKGKGRGKASRSAATLHDSTSAGEGRESLSPNEQAELYEALCDLLESMFVFLGKVALDACQEAVVATALALKDLLKMDSQKCESAGAVETARDFSMISNQTSRAFALMHRLMEPRHDRRGGQTVMARCIMPRLLMKSIDGTIAPANSSIPAHFNHLKDLAITFIDHRIQTKSEEEADTVFRVLQNMCAKCPDRAEYRTKVAPVVAQVTLMLPRPLVQDFVDFLSIFAQSAKTAYRVFAVELAPQLVSRFPADKEEEAVFEQLRSTLLTMVLKRCNDKAPTVRTRALTILSTILSSADAVYSALLERISKELSLEEGDNGAEADDGYGSDHRVDRSSGDALMNLIEARCDDEKVFARKAAVLALEALYPVLNPESGLKALKMLKTRTLDISVMVRKQGADSLTHLLAAHPSDFVRNTWLQAVLPLVTDRESSVQTFVCKLISEALIAKINADDDANVWRLLALIEQQQDLRRYLLRALIHLAKENQLNQRIVAVLEEKTRDSDKSNAAWMLLAELSGVFKVNPKLARIRWYALDDSADRMLGYMAKIFAGAVSRMTDADRAELLQDVTEKLMSFRVDVKNLSAVLNAANCLFDAVGEEAPGRKDMEQWCRRFVGVCESRLSSIIFTPSHDATREIASEEDLVRLLVSLGEAVQYCPTLITTRIFTIVQAFICSDAVQFEMSRHHTHHVTNQHGETTDQHQSQQSQEQSQEGQQQSQQGQQQQGSPLVTKAVRAHAVTTLGKLCLQDEDGAKRCVPALVRELQTNADHVIRNNIIVVLSDLCVRFTLLVDQHTGTIAACLKDRSTLVRRQTLTLLTNLIKEGFLKWQGELMYRFVSTLLDECEQVREFAEFCLVHVLLRQFPGMFFHHFIECLFFFNAVKHPSWSAASEAAALAMGEMVVASNENQKFSLKGERHFDERMRLYRFMVKQFSDQEKFSIAARISHDVFGAVSEGAIGFDSDGVQELVKDALKVMVCPELKLSMAIGNKDGGEDDEPTDTAPQVVQEAAKKAITAVFRRAVMDQILPSVISLKAFMQRPEHRGPLYRDVMILIKDLAKDHREDLDNFLASDPILKSEIDFDLKKHDLMEKRREEKRVAALQKDKEQEQDRSTAVRNTPRRSNGNNLDAAADEHAPNAAAAAPVTAPMDGVDDIENDGQRGKASSSSSDSASVDAQQAEPMVVEAEGDEPPVAPQIVVDQEHLPKEPQQAVAHDNDDEQDEEMNDADVENEEPMDMNTSPAAKKSRGLTARAISTPHTSQLPDVTFALGNDFNFTLVTPIVRPSKRSTRASKAPGVQSIQEDE